MPRDPTRFSRVSVGWADSAQSIVDVDAGDTGPVWSVTGQAQYDDPVRVSSTLTVTSNLSVGGTSTLDGAVSVGGGADFTAISSTTHEIDFGSVAADVASTTTVGITGAARGDTFLVTPDSEWSGTDYVLNVFANSGDTAGEVNVIANNSSNTAHNPAGTVFRIDRIAWSDYL